MNWDRSPCFFSRSWRSLIHLPMLWGLPYTVTGSLAFSFLIPSLTLLRVTGSSPWLSFSQNSALFSDMHKYRSACQPTDLMPYSKDLRLTE